MTYTILDTTKPHTTLSQELHAAMRRAGQNPTESEVQDMINSVSLRSFQGGALSLVRVPPDTVL